MTELRYAKVINEETKQVQVGVGCSDDFYEEIGMSTMEVERGYDGLWYVAGYAPTMPELTPEELKHNRIEELKRLLAQDDYKVRKCAEYNFLGLAMPYDINEIHERNEAWREEINQLEGELNG